MAHYLLHMGEKRKCLFTPRSGEHSSEVFPKEGDALFPLVADKSSITNTLN
jgi:hypothetical protein